MVTKKTTKTTKTVKEKEPIKKTAVKKETKTAMPVKESKTMPIQKMTMPRIQTAEGWKRSQAKRA